MHFVNAAGRADEAVPVPERGRERKRGDGLHFNIFSYSDFLDAVERLMVGVCGGNQICDCQSETGTVPRHILKAVAPSTRGREQEQGGEKNSGKDDRVVRNWSTNPFSDARNYKRRGCKNEPHNQGAAATVLWILISPGEELRNQKNCREAEIEDEEDIPGRT